MTEVISSSPHREEPRSEGRSSASEQTRARFKKAAIAAAVLVGGLVAYRTWRFSSDWNTPYHSPSFFSASVRARLTQLSENLLKSVTEDWLVIAPDRLDGPSIARVYQERYGDSLAVAEARQVIAEYGFSKVMVVNQWSNDSVQFTYYRAGERQLYDYVYFEDGVPPSDSIKHGGVRRLDDHWLFGTAIVGNEEATDGDLTDSQLPPTPLP